MGIGAKPLRLTKEWDSYPAWSPDGRQITFLRVFDPLARAAIYTVPSAGGSERKLIDISGPFLAGCPGYSWSPTGDWLALAEMASEGQGCRIVHLSLATLEKQPLTSPPPKSGGDSFPALSPDGSQLAFVRGGPFQRDVWVQPLKTGEPRPLTFKNYSAIYSVAWMADGADIVFSQREGEGRRVVLRVGLSGGEPQAIPGLGQNAGGASIRGTRMVHEQWTTSGSALWRLAGPRASPSRLPATKFIASAGSASNNNADYSPDGRKIAFESDRSGQDAIWISDSDGSNPVQLTSFESHCGTPRWSPDGRRLAFDSLDGGDANIYVVDAEGGKARRLTPEPSQDIVGTWSHDGRFVYFGSDRSGQMEIWKVGADGGAALQVTRGGGTYGLESPDGRYLYYSKMEPPVGISSGIWRMPLSGGAATMVVEGPIEWCDWTLGRSGLYFMPRVPDGAEWTIRYLDFASGRTTEIYRDKAELRRQWLSVSPDEKWILYGEWAPTTSELVLVENFR